MKDIPVSCKMVLRCEVGLSGEIRAVNRIRQRICQKHKELGFEQIFISNTTLKDWADLNIK
jgi:DNA repair protein RadA/Sms